jgi:hypothetical protein
LPGLQRRPDERRWESGVTGDDIQNELVKLNEVGVDQRLRHAALIASDIRDIMGDLADSVGLPIIGRETEDSEIAAAHAHSLVHVIAQAPIPETVQPKGSGLYARALLLRARCRAAVAHGAEYECIQSFGVRKDTEKAKRIYRKSAQEACDEAHRVLVGLLVLAVEKRDE